MRKIRLLFLFIIFSAFSFPAKSYRITGVFGEPRSDHFHSGIDIGGEFDVYSVLPGEVIYYFQASDFPFLNNFGYGNCIVIQHNNNLRTYYFHLKDGTIKKNIETVNENVCIGKSGNTGYSSGPHLHFAIEDIENKKYINPLLKFPKYYIDTQKPVISKILIKQREKYVTFNNWMSIKKTNNIKCLIETYDFINNIKAGIFELKTELNGILYLRYTFNSLEKQNFLLLPPGFKYQDIYEGKYIKLNFLNLTNGNYNIKFIVSDFAGNSATMTRHLKIK